MKIISKFAIIVICILLIASIFRICFGFKNSLTLTDLLNVLKNAPVVDFNTTWGVDLLSMIGSIEDYGVFSFIYPLLYAFATVIDFAVFALSAIVTALNWLIYFASWLIGAPLLGV